MVANNIRSLRLSRGLTLEQLAEKVGLSHTHVQRIETGKRGLSVPVAERFATALNVHVSEIFGMVAANPSVAVRLTPGGLAEDAEPFSPKAGERLRLQPRKGENIDPWRIKTNALNRLGIVPGQIRFVDLSIEAVDNVQPLQCVVAQIYGPSGEAKTVMRQFVPPSLLITNSDTVSEMPLDIDKGEAYIKGVILDDFTTLA